MAVTETQQPLDAALTGLARTLVSLGKINTKLALEAQQQAQIGKIGLIDALLAVHAIAPKNLAQTLSKIFSLPVLDLSFLSTQNIPKNLIEAQICLQYQVLPIAKRANKWVIATADPSNTQAHEKIKFIAQTQVDWIVVERDKLIKTLEVLFSNATESVEEIVGGDFDFEASTFSEDDSPLLAQQSAEIDDAPVVRFLQKMLLDAVSMHASDLHFEPYEHHYRVRFRIDGELREIASPPPIIKEKLASRIKVLSRLDIAEKRIPQDGRMKLKISSERVIDFRVSTLPTLFGEKIVIRILDPSSARMGIDALGYDPEEKERLLKAVAMPYGMILVTGPTGSGKTVSLYTCLNLLNKPGVNIATVEDPSEINMPGVNQVNVNEKAGLTFSSALKSFLRQDPDIIMVGEIRDLETGDIAIKASQTGHLVLSTLHTNDAPATLTRLRNMGIASFNIASSVVLITAQRLAKRLCNNCKTMVDLPESSLLEMGFKPEEIDDTWKPYKKTSA